ncbi:MAG TPA: hydantoinase/oxoprolinase family protein [Acidimicrobiia bacterium]|nr:hydantoinase/oxoprolinase family protein [Acidimicrobiia bacterium]
MSETVCIGVDVGGTFTDAVLTIGPRTWRAKSPTTPRSLVDGVLAATESAVRRSGSTLGELLPRVDRFGLGTTAVTNVLASRTGRRVGLLVTRGFADMILHAGGKRVLDEDGWAARPPELVARHDIVEVDERVDRDGRVLTPIALEPMLDAVDELVARGVEVIAVSYLWSFLNPAHEEATVEVIGQRHPSLPVVAGAALHPAIREYERTTVAVLNAYVSGALPGIGDVEARLRAEGLVAPLLLVHSGGGSITVAEASRRPLGLAVSGPAAGVAAAIGVGAAAGHASVVTCDMGGTSFDVSVVVDGHAARRTRGEVGNVWTALSVVDVESIGAGGGSIGWVDARGMLRVGPRSAGAEPGPACYGRGGREPTITDALVVLGYIDPGRFLGGTFTLDADAAHRACERLGARLGLTADEVAWGMREVAHAGMTKATRARLAALGLDPRRQALLSFGGSGALFTPGIARAIGAATVLVPRLAPVLSAFGAATIDVRRERICPVLATFPVSPATIEKPARELAAMVDADLARDGVDPADRSVSFEVDMRFAKQVFELPIPLATADPTEAVLDELVDAFRAEYRRRYGPGSIVLGSPVELVSLRAVGAGATPRAGLERVPRRRRGATPEPSARAVRLERGPGGVREVAVHDSGDLAAGDVVAGPALVDAPDTTVWIPSGALARVDDHGTLRMEVGG